MDNRTWFLVIYRGSGQENRKKWFHIFSRKKHQRTAGCLERTATASGGTRFWWWNFVDKWKIVELRPFLVHMLAHSTILYNILIDVWGTGYQS